MARVSTRTTRTAPAYWRTCPIPTGTRTTRTQDPERSARHRADAEHLDPGQALVEQQPGNGRRAGQLEEIRFTDIEPLEFDLWQPRPEQPASPNVTEPRSRRVNVIGES